MDFGISILFYSGLFGMTLDSGGEKNSQISGFADIVALELQGTQLRAVSPGGRCGAAVAWSPRNRPGLAQLSHYRATVAHGGVGYRPGPEARKQRALQGMGPAT